MRLASFVLALTMVVGASSSPSATPARRTVPVVSTTSADPFNNALSFLDGASVDPQAYPNTAEGFSAYLKAVGVSDYTAADLTRPNHPDIARKLGYSNFVPPQKWWNRGAVLALVAQGVHRAAGAPVNIRNWWRPDDYNRQPGVDGAKASDHLTATALDLDYPSPTARAKAEQFLRSLQKKAPWLNMSLGLGPVTTHVGVLSPHGSREWHYAGYAPATKPHPVRRRA